MKYVLGKYLILCKIINQFKNYPKNVSCFMGVAGFSKENWFEMNLNKNDVWKETKNLTARKRHHTEI